MRVMAFTVPKPARSSTFPNTMVVAAIVLMALGLALIGGCQPREGVVATAIPDYQTARKIFWSKVYPGSAETLYCGDMMDSDDRTGFNVEHVFPMSWVTNALSCGTRAQCRSSSQQFNIIEGDLHNLYPARSTVNSARRSYRFGEVHGESRAFGQACDFEVNDRARVAEPRPAMRGEIARAMFYMAYQYRDQGLTIFARSGNILQQWHADDPPDEREKKRNLRISSLQGTANLFVEQPEILDQLILDEYTRGAFRE